MMTNRDLYLEVTEFAASCRLSLKDYLVQLKQRFFRLKNRGALTGEMLTACLTGRSPLQAWETDRLAEADYAVLEKTLEDQIRDLEDMGENGTLENKYRYFGVDAPSGRRWYNFDVASYLECGISGFFGGWEEGDETGRILVPGQVVVPTGNGGTALVDPSSIEEPVVRLEPIPWKNLAEFFIYCREYE